MYRNVWCLLNLTWNTALLAELNKYTPWKNQLILKWLVITNLKNRDPCVKCKRVTVWNNVPKVLAHLTGRTTKVLQQKRKRLKVPSSCGSFPSLNLWIMAQETMPWTKVAFQWMCSNVFEAWLWDWQFRIPQQFSTVVICWELLVLEFPNFFSPSELVQIRGTSIQLWYGALRHSPPRQQSFPAETAGKSTLANRSQSKIPSF